MHGFPLDTATTLLGDLVNVLRPTDTFDIVVFERGFEVFSPVSVPATTANLNRARLFMGSKSGGGGTRLLNGLQRAVELPGQPGPSRSIVLLTDGDIDAEADVFDYVRENLDDANFDPIRSIRDGAAVLEAATGDSIYSSNNPAARIITRIGSRD
jgi:Ca-activated chloride channel family protein